MTYSQSYKRYVLAVLLVVYIINFMDRQILALLMQPIKDELQISDTALGLLSGIAFSLFYSTLGIPIARWADKGSRVNIISLAVIVWSGMTALSGMAANFIQLVIARIGVGVGEAGCMPPSHSLMSDYFTPAERTRAMSIYMMGIPIGVMLGFMIGGYVNEYYGWRAAFFILGIPGLIIGLVVKFTVKEPPRGFSDGLKQQSTETIPLKKVMATLFGRPSYTHIVVANSLFALGSYGLGQWMPTFFIRSHGMDTAEIGLWSAFVYGSGAGVGIYMGGYLADKFGAKDKRHMARIPAYGLMAAVPLYFWVLTTGSKEIAFLVQVPLNLFAFLTTAPTFALIQGLAGVRMRAMAAAFALLIINLVGLGLGPLCVGALSDLLSLSFGQEGLRWALMGFSLVFLWSAFHYWRAGNTLAENLKEAAADT